MAHFPRLIPRTVAVREVFGRRVQFMRPVGAKPVERGQAKCPRGKVHLAGRCVDHPGPRVNRGRRPS